MKMGEENHRKKIRLAFIGGKHPSCYPTLPSKLQKVEHAGIVHPDMYNNIHNLLNGIDFKKENAKIEKLSSELSFKQGLVEVNKVKLSFQKEILTNYCDQKLVDERMMVLDDTTKSPRHLIQNLLDKTRDANDTSIFI